MKTPKIILFIALLVLQIDAISQHKKKSNDELSDHFSRERHERKKERLASPFSKKANKPKKRRLLPSFYATVVKKAADNNQLPSYFNSKLQKEKKRTQEPDFFTKPLFKRKRSASKDHFSRKKEEKKRSEDDLEHDAKSKTIYRKNFVGERRRIFNRDPNKKKTHRLRFKPKDPFGKRKKDEQQSVPRGETDLFNNGVLPKMKDFR